MLIDTHAHLDGFYRSGALESVLQRARSAGLKSIIAIGTEPEDWALHREIAKANAGLVRFTVGIHPCSVRSDWKEAAGTMEAYWAGSGEAPVGLGECGLDRFHLPKDPVDAQGAFQLQCEAFEVQLALAKRLDCPIVVHSRGAFRECMDMIGASGVNWKRVVFHCFSEGPVEMRELAEKGGRGSFTGILTYKNAENVRAAAKVQGLDRLMVETDAPYLAPVPHRGEKNEPAFVRHVAEKAAELFGVEAAQVGEITSANARAFFGL